MKPYSVDLRERIAAAVAQGFSTRAVARQFSVSPATVCRYAHYREQRGTLAPKPSPGSRKRLDAGTVAALVAQVARKNDQTIRELHAWLTRHYPQVRVSPATVHRALVRAGLTYKKRRWSPVNETTRGEPPGATP